MGVRRERDDKKDTKRGKSAKNVAVSSANTTAMPLPVISQQTSGNRQKNQTFLLLVWEGGG